jgi:hypothetical protein
LITLTFRPVDGESTVAVRGVYFRICADGTLRGPDNDVAARSVDSLWQLAHRRHRSFECGGPVYLRITDNAGRRTHIGPYDFLKAAGGAIFTRDSCLGTYTPRAESGMGAVWREITFLTALPTGGGFHDAQILP